MKRNAFSRAWEYLNDSPSAKYSAILAGTLTSILFVGLIALLGLFLDLLVSHGRIPTYTELTQAQRDSFAETWKNINLAQREEALNHIGLAKSDHADFLLTEISQTRPAEEQIRWRAYVWLYLRDNIGLAAANSFQPKLPTWRLSEFLGFPPSGEHGVLGLVIRDRNHWTSGLVNSLAQWNSWSWSPVFASTANLSYMTGLLLIAALIAVLRAVLVLVMYRSAATAVVEAVTRMRRQVYQQTYQLGTLVVRQLGPGEAVGIFTKHAETVGDALYTALTTTIREPMKFGLLLLFALIVHFWLGLACLVFAVLVVIVAGQFATATRQNSRAARGRAAGYLALLEESLTLLRLVKCYLMESFNRIRVERQLGEFAKAQVARYRDERAGRPVLVFLAAMGAVGLLYVAGRVVLHEGLELSSMIVLGVALGGLYEPLTNYLSARRALNKGKESAAVLFEFLDRKPELPQAMEAEQLAPLTSEIAIAGVSLRDPSTGRMLLNNVTLRIPAGRTIGLVGSDEAEKHAFVYLLPRFLDPTEGEIRIDGRGLKWVSLDSLRTQIALVLQHNLVFNDTVANNIGCGDPSYSLPQIIEAAKIAHAHQFIQRLPNGYETPIGDLGVGLKLGEKFRIALARAILRDPSLLIIEEPLQQLDDDTKVLIDDTFNRLLPGRTTVFLPHRINTLRSCEHLIFLHKGKVEASGVHRDLLASNDLYKHLYYMEFNEFAETADRKRATATV